MRDSPLLDWPVQDLQRELCAVLPDLCVEVAGTLPSTNSELMRRAREGAMGPVLLVAEHQSAGRGRMGRIWQSGSGEALMPAVGATAPALPSLTFSLALPLAPQDWSGLSLAVGVSVVRSLHPALGLKWPNDIWLQDRKLGGILIETASRGAHRTVVIGIGLNLLPRDATGLSMPPASLQELLPQGDAPGVLQRIAPALLRAVLLFEGQGFAPFQQEFMARDVLQGRAVVLSDGTHGQAAGVDAGGVLLVHTPAGMQHVNSNEVSVRPAPAGAQAVAPVQQP